MRNNRMYTELLELLGTDSASGKERQIAEKLRSKMTLLGFTVCEDDVGKHFDGECGNLLCRREGELPGSILLCSHMDRVPNGYGIRPVEKNGILYSDGTTILAADDVSGIAAILEGLRRVLSAEIPLPTIEVLFTVGEEIGMFGSRFFDMSQLQSKIGFIFDSPGRTGRFILAAPGMYRLGASVKGKAAHAGNFPERGINATRCICEMVATLNTGRLDTESTSNFPDVRTGTKACNVVCDFAEMHGEARSHNAQKLQNYVEYFEAHCKEVADRYGCELTLEMIPYFLPFSIDTESKICQIAKAACRNLEIEPLYESGGGGMDANNFNSAGLVSIGVATGYSGNHTKAEQLDLAEFFRAGDLAEQLILQSIPQL